MLGMFASRTRNEGTNNISGIFDEPNYLGELIHRADIDKQTFDNNYDQNNLIFQKAIADCSNLLALQPQEGV